MAHMERFLQSYTEFQTYLLHYMSIKFSMDDHRLHYMKQMMDTTCLGGKCNRGLCVLDVVEAMAGSLSTTAESMELMMSDACVGGWMIELLQAHFLVEDDIMDNSKMRRDKPCWYLHPGVTTQCAINDGLILLAWAMELCVHYFSERKFFGEMMRVFNFADFTTTIGQMYDVTSMCDSSKLDANVKQANVTDYVEFTTLNYQRIVRHKTAYYTYWLPLMMGLLISGTEKAVTAETVEKVAMLMGEYFQAQDDVMDCFTPPEKLGKIGTDIEDAKCSWLSVTFLANASDAQKEIFKANYGRPEQQHVEAIKKLYREANLEEKFAVYENEVAKEINTLLEQLRQENAAFAESVKKLWDKTYKRKK